MLSNKLFKLSLILSLSAFSLNAASTMCFKESHTSLATIESVKLDGGECRGNRSVQEMKNEGWNVSDVKVENATTGKNYIYVFTRDSSAAYNEDILLEKMQKRIDKENKEKEEQRKAKISEALIAEGKGLYVSRCQKCHGEKANEPYSTARALSTLSEKDMQVAIVGYNTGSYNRGTGIVMQTISQTITQDMITKIYAYLQNINSTKKEVK